MPRYIDAEALKRDLIDNRSFYPAIVKNAIENAPTVDVVPRSEVEELKERLDFLHKENCKLTQSNFENLVKIVEEAEQEVAREILQIIDGITPSSRCCSSVRCFC